MTDYQVSPTLPCPTLVGMDPDLVLGERESMALIKKPNDQNDATVKDSIAAALRQMHDSVATEVLPDDFLRLLGEIDAKIAAKKPRL